MQLASGHAPADTDGRSFAPLLISALPKSPKPWKTLHLTTYQSIKTTECLWTTEEGAPYNPCGRHPVDAAGNTHTSIRLINATHNLLYAEFTDVTDKAGWNFDLAAIEFFALFDLSKDPWQLHNSYRKVSRAMQIELHAILVTANHCRGQHPHGVAPPAPYFAGALPCP